MVRRGVKIQLAVFLTIALVAIGYAGFRFGGLGKLVNPPYTISAHFDRSGGIFPRASVSLLGTKVGTVEGLHIADNGDVVVTMTIDNGVELPADVTATVTNGSPIGEQYVGLEPQSAGPPYLHDGGVIAKPRTSTPVPVEDLLANVNSLAKSVPKEDLATDLVELAKATNGLGPELQRLLDQSNALVRTGLGNLNDLIGLLNSSATVLDTQVASGERIQQFSSQLAGLTDQLRALDPTFASAFRNGIRAATESTGLLRANQQALPKLLTHLLTLTDVALPRQQQLRKSLVVLPWAFQRAMQAFGYCDKYNLETGEPVESSCHYNPKTGKPVHTARFALQLMELPGQPPHNPCIDGYQGTTKYLPSGEPPNGQGPLEQPDTPPNNEAHCAAPPTDPGTPNVRGAQNVQHPDAQPQRPPAPRQQDIAVYDPNSGYLATPNGRTYRLGGSTNEPAPGGQAGLTWLLLQPLTPKGG